MWATKHTCIVPLKQIEYGFGYIIIRSSYTPYSIYLRETVGLSPFREHFPFLDIFTTGTEKTGDVATISLRVAFYCFVCRDFAWSFVLYLLCP